MKKMETNYTNQAPCKHTLKRENDNLSLFHCRYLKDIPGSLSKIANSFLRSLPLHAAYPELDLTDASECQEKVLDVRKNYDIIQGGSLFL